MEDNRITTAVFKEGERATFTSPLYQYDYGQELIISGLELPATFEVHFSNEQYGTATTSIYADGKVTIPDTYLTKSGEIYAWIYLHDTADDGETEYKIIIPVQARADVSDQPPTPEQQSVITETIAALNEAVEQCESNVEHYPKIDDETGNWNTWDAESEDWSDTGVHAQGEQGEQGVPGQDGKDGADGKDGQDGFSPVVEVSSITGGHEVSVTDASGTETFDVMDGEDGAPGADGHSPVVTASKSGKVTTVYVDGSSIAEIDDGADGQDGADGYSPSASVSKSGSTATITITDKNGTTTASVSDGADGQDGQDGQDGVSPVLSVGTVTTGEAGTDASVTMTGTSANPVLNFTIPRGNTGEVSNADLQSAILAILPKKTVSGAIASFNDAQAGYPLVNLEAAITPIQSGTGDPSPSNPRPISIFSSATITRCGKNLFNGTDVLNSYISTTITSSASTRTCYCRCNPNTTYTVSKTAGQRFGVAYTKELPANGVTVYGAIAGNTNASITITTGADAVYLVAYVYHGSFDSGTADAMVASVQIEVGSTPTAYEAYNATTETVQFGQTVYGGTWKASEGKVEDTYGKVVFDGTETGWSANTPNAGFIRQIDDMKSGNAQVGYCDRFATITTNAGFGVRFGGNNKILYANHITDNVSGISSLDDWKAWLGQNPITVIYPLATPTEISVDAVNLTAQDGVNNIVADTGDSSVTYGAKIQS